MPIRELKDQIARLPEQPGVYLYFNAAGETIYVGKARALRDRVRNYLGAYGADPKTDALLDEIARLEVIVTDSVVEALALENNLIKQRSPRYNILLRDDKNYPYLQLTTNEAFPRVLVARRVERDGSFYAGPFLPAHFARKTMALTHRLFGIRSCNEVITGKRDRPCLEYDIKRCIAPCVDTICSPEEYGGAVEADAAVPRRQERRARQDAAGADGRRPPRPSGSRRRRSCAMRCAPCRRCRIASRRWRRPSSGTATCSGMKLGPAGVVVQVFQVRRGRVVERIELGHRGARSSAPGDGEVLEAAIQQFYELRVAPPEVHVPAEPDEREALETWLSERAGRRVRIVVPQRGEKRGLVDLANRNAALAYQSRFNQTTAAQYDALETLQAVLGLPALPRRIECFDISTIQGSETVASMVVCEDGRMRRGEYRKFRIRGLETGGWRLELGGWSSAATSAASLQPPSPSRQSNNDFAAMHEVVLPPLSQAARAGRAVSRSDPDRRRQGTAVGRVRGARRAGAGQSGRRRHRQEGRAAVHARPRRADRAGRQRSGAAAGPADPRRSASLRGHVPSPGADDARPAIGARRRAGRRAAAPAHAADARSAAWRACGARRARSWRRSSARKWPTPFLRFSQAAVTCLSTINAESAEHAEGFISAISAVSALNVTCWTSTSRKSSSRSSFCCFP